MPIQTFTCPKCGKFDLILTREMYSKIVSAPCITCDKESSADLFPLPARRNPAHGIQN